MMRLKLSHCHISYTQRPNINFDIALYQKDTYNYQEQQLCHRLLYTLVRYIKILRPQICPQK